MSDLIRDFVLISINKITSLAIPIVNDLAGLPFSVLVIISPFHTYEIHPLKIFPLLTKQVRLHRTLVHPKTFRGKLQRQIFLLIDAVASKHIFSRLSLNPSIYSGFPQSLIELKHAVNLANTLHQPCKLLPIYRQTFLHAFGQSCSNA